MKPIALTEDQITTIRYIIQNGVVTPTDHPAALDAKRYNTALFDLIDGDFILVSPTPLGGYELRAAPKALIYEKIHPGFRLDDATRKTYALKGLLTIAGYVAAAVILLLAIIL